MLSPIGIRVKDPDDQDDPLDARFKNKVGPPSWVKSIARFSWQRKISPFTYGRYLGQYISLKAIKGYVNRRLKIANEES